MNKQTHIQSRWVFINRLFIVLILFFLVVLLLREYQRFNDTIAYFNQTSYEYEVHNIQHEVDNRIEEIDSVKQEIENNVKQSLIDVVTDVNFFAHQVVLNADPSLTLDQKRDLYIDTVYQYDLQEDEYLFFAMDLDGISYLSGLTKNLEGTDITYLQDVVTGEYFVLDMIDIIENSDDNTGFITYYWIKEVGGEHIQKTSYLLYNPEVDLFIGTGVYEVDYIQTVQDELFTRISSYYSGEDDYIYIMDYEGNIIFHPMENFDREELLEIKTTEGRGFHEYIVEELQDKPSVVFEYYFYFTGEEQLKTAYVRRIEEWDLYIGRSFVTDKLQVEQQQYLNSILVGYITFNAVTLAAIILLVVILKRQINHNFRDIQEEFNYQNNIIKESSYRDPLTGVYNRKYLDDTFEHGCDDCNSLGVLMLDANGLKLINDTYGHHAGDELLKALVTIAQDNFPDGLIIRWGGDEFLVVLKNVTNQEIEEQIKQFYTDCSNQTIEQFTISASVGYELSTKQSKNLFDIIKKAESKMYKNKMYESVSTKRLIIDNILQTLYNNFSFEELHSENVKNYALMIGEQLGFNNETMSKLRLAALMHDVGKIGVPDHIISKPGPLTDNEFEEIRKHPEKGMRILSAYPELSEYGNYALTHHERFDGNGYPKGLKGKDIPLISRIITIADAFDAMTSNRVYKKTITKDEAIKELIANKGTQFDPELVDAFTLAIKEPND